MKCKPKQASEAHEQQLYAESTRTTASASVYLKLLQLVYYPAEINDWHSLLQVVQTLLLLLFRHGKNPGC